MWFGFKILIHAVFFFLTSVQVEFEDVVMVWEEEDTRFEFEIANKSKICDYKVKEV